MNTTRERHALAGQTVKLSSITPELDGCEFWVEDWYGNVNPGRSVADPGTWAELNYMRRAAGAGLPLDNNTVYGKVGPFGHIVHVTELVVS